MKLFSLGCDRTEQTRLGVEISDEPLFLYTPTDLDRIVGTAMTEEQQLVAEASEAWKSHKISDDTWKTFQMFHNEFHTWLSQVGKPPYGLMKFNIPGHYQNAKRYRERIADWRALIARAGATAVGPATRLPEGPHMPHADESTKLLIAVVAGTGALIALTNLIGKFKGDAAPERAYAR